MVNPEWMKGIVNPEGKWNPKGRWNPMEIYRDYLRGKYPNPIHDAIKEVAIDDSVLVEFKRHISVMSVGALKKLERELFRMKGRKSQLLEAVKNEARPRRFEMEGVTTPAKKHIGAMFGAVFNSLEVILAKARELNMSPVYDSLRRENLAIDIIREMITSRIATLSIGKED